MEYLEFLDDLKVLDILKFLDRLEFLDILKFLDRLGFLEHIKLELAKYYKDSEMTAFISERSRSSK